MHTTQGRKTVGSKEKEKGKRERHCVPATHRKKEIASTDSASARTKKNWVMTLTHIVLLIHLMMQTQKESGETSAD